MSNLSVKFANILLLTAAVAIPAATLAQSTDEPLADGVLATVNGRPIPRISVENVAQQIVETGEEVDLPRILDELINLELLTQAAEELDLDKLPEISATLQLQYTQTMANAYLASKSAEMSFTEEELRAEYDAQSANVVRDEFRASHILLETAEDAMSVIAELDAGKSFAQAAAEHSIDPAGENGGDLGWFVGATMDPAFAGALADMNVGDISSEPVQTEFGFHVINLVESRDAALPDFNSVKTGLTNLAIRRALAAHVEELKTSADIQTR